MAKPDTPGVIAPPPLIYLGFLFVGWGLAELGARPEAVEAAQPKKASPRKAGRAST